MRLGGWLIGSALAAIPCAIAVVSTFEGCKGASCLASVRGQTMDPCAVATSTAVSHPASTACFDAPEICPDLSPVRFCARTISSTNSVNILLKNRGENPMTVTGIKVHGDTRCSFVNPEFSPALGTKIQGGDSMVIRFAYKPASPGEDHIAIEVTSDSDNLPTLFIPVCGKGVNPPSDPDAGMPDVGEVREPSASCSPSCKDQSMVPATNCWTKSSTKTDGG
jgi:hypothetical protein